MKEIKFSRDPKGSDHEVKEPVVLKIVVREMSEEAHRENENHHDDQRHRTTHLQVKVQEAPGNPEGRTFISDQTPVGKSTTGSTLQGLGTRRALGWSLREKKIRPGTDPTFQLRPEGRQARLFHLNDLKETIHHRFVDFRQFKYLRSQVLWLRNSPNASVTYPQSILLS